MLTSNDDGIVHLWSADLQVELDVLKGPCAAAKVAFSHDDTRAVVGCKNGAAYIWGLPPQNKASFQGVAEESMEFSSDGRHVLSCCNIGGARLWRIDAQGRPTLLRAFKSNYPRAFSPDGSHVLVGEGGMGDGGVSYSPILHILDLDGKRKPAILDNRFGIMEAAFSRDGSRVVVVSNDENARVWHVNEEGASKLLNTLKPHSRGVKRVSRSRDGAQILMAFGDGTVQLLHADGKGTPIGLPSHTPVEQLAHSSDGKYALTVADRSTETGSNVQEIRVWRSDGKEEVQLSRDYYSAKFSADGKYLLGVASNKILVRPMEHPAEQFELVTPLVPISDATFSRDGSLVVANSANGALLWDVRARWRDPITLAAGTEMKAATFSADGRHVLTVAKDGTAQLWPVDDELLSQHLQQVSTVCLSTEQRRQYLGETEQEARSQCEDCERRLGRTEESCALE